ncbi:glutaredoxin [Psychromonas sp. CNPT3]|uniref:glutaredoxin 3 n=1 Tax=Psychromonas sp. CNPT3 TaxID=314282 RepID=UPI00006E3902|nr:glutaredoxin 3 [Psychromonas sp. CNPT3]AGH82229.1 glutaredoxin [Psychromonas sp. CNPT3]
MVAVTIYTTPWCPYCIRALRLLDNKKVQYTQIDVSDPTERAKMQALTGGHTVPQILINAQPIGGCDELYALEHEAKLDALLNAS